MMGIVGVLSALWHREKTGVGQFIDISLLDVMTALVAGEHFDAEVAKTLDVLARHPAVAHLVDDA